MSKKPEGKPELGLVYQSTLVAIAKVRRFGINKHGNSEDWRTTEEVKHQDAILRHIMAYVDGEELDRESGLPHLAHALTTISFEIERKYGKANKMMRYSDKDNLQDIH